MILKKVKFKFKKSDWKKYSNYEMMKKNSKRKKRFSHSSMDMQAPPKKSDQNLCMHKTWKINFKKWTVKKSIINRHFFSFFISCNLVKNILNLFLKSFEREVFFHRKKTYMKKLGSSTEGYTQRNHIWNFNQNQIWIVHFPIDLAPSGIPIGAKPIGKREQPKSSKFQFSHLTLRE